MTSPLDTFVADCQVACGHSDAQARVETIMSEAVGDPAIHEAVQAYDSFTSLQDLAVHRSAQLTVLAGVLPAGFRAAPHDHNIWSVVGVCRGQENNEFFERKDVGLESVGGASVIGPGVLPNDAAVIHAISNPLEEPLLVLHAYGGDLFSTPRSTWDPESQEEIPFDWEKVKPPSEV